jgi:acyl-CoA synthetase (AMP-forming)/AMP-acid ligase II
MHSSSKSNDSLWMKIGGDGYAWRVVDGILQIKAKSAMIGYLNAPSPFTEDGWFITGDMVEVDGEYIRILGRKSDIINVGGLKVYPIEVEEEIRKMDNVADVVVFGKSNPLIGNIVAARVTLISPEPPSAFRPRLRSFLAARLDGYKVPSQIEITSDNQINSRFKRVRTEGSR